MEETDCASFFDQIDDLLDFPVEDMETGLPPVNNREPFPSIWSVQPDALPCSDAVFSNTNSSSADLSAELSVPYEDIVQLEWLSTFVEDSFSGENLTINKLELPEKESHPPRHETFHTASPVSVLDSSSSSCSSDKAAPLSPEALAPMGRCGRARSKRPRPTTFNPRPAIQLISPSSSSAETGNLMSISPRESSSSENYGESRPAIKILKRVSNPEIKKKKKKKIKVTAPMDRTHQENVASSQTVRKCLHCEITKTPQWRAGPLGPKTLCNACGVRYKSGRLFPEYRPAASPTFVPSLHSNSHKKVVEMRSKAGEPDGPTGQENAMIPSELVPNTTLAREDYM